MGNCLTQFLFSQHSEPICQSAAIWPLHKEGSERLCPSPVFQMLQAFLLITTGSWTGPLLRQPAVYLVMGFPSVCIKVRAEEHLLSFLPVSVSSVSNSFHGAQASGSQKRPFSTDNIWFLLFTNHPTSSLSQDFLHPAFYGTFKGRSMISPVPKTLSTTRMLEIQNLYL